LDASVPTPNENPGLAVISFSEFETEAVVVEFVPKLKPTAATGGASASLPSSFFSSDLVSKVEVVPKLNPVEDGADLGTSDEFLFNSNPPDFAGVLGYSFDEPNLKPALIVLEEDDADGAPKVKPVLPIAPPDEDGVGEPNEKPLDPMLAFVSPAAAALSLLSSLEEALECPSADSEVASLFFGPASSDVLSPSHEIHFFASFGFLT
jgi:hypothetical protein